MNSKKSKPKTLGSGMKLIRGGVELDVEIAMACACEPVDCHSYGSQGSSGCACDCWGSAGSGENNFNKAVQINPPVFV